MYWERERHLTGCACGAHAADLRGPVPEPQRQRSAHRWPTRRLPGAQTGSGLGFCVAGPGFEPVKAKPTVLQIPPMGCWPAEILIGGGFLRLFSGTCQPTSEQHHHRPVRDPAASRASAVGLLARSMASARSSHAAPTPPACQPSSPPVAALRQGRLISSISRGDDHVGYFDQGRSRGHRHGD